MSRFTRLMPGAYSDGQGGLHLDVEEMLEAGGYADTPQNRRTLTEAAERMAGAIVVANAAKGLPKPCVVCGKLLDEQSFVREEVVAAVGRQMTVACSSHFVLPNDKIQAPDYERNCELLARAHAEAEGLIEKGAQQG